MLVKVKARNEITQEIEEIAVNTEGIVAILQSFENKNCCDIVYNQRTIQVIAEKDDLIAALNAGADWRDKVEKK